MLLLLLLLRVAALRYKYITCRTEIRLNIFHRRKIAAVSLTKRRRVVLTSLTETVPGLGQSTVVERMYLLSRNYYFIFTRD